MGLDGFLAVKLGGQIGTSGFGVLFPFTYKAF